MLIAIYKLEVDREGVGSFTARQGYFGRWLLLVILGALQAIIVTVGDLVIGVQCVSPLLFVLGGIAISFTYVNIIYALSTTFKHIGKAIGVILVIVQIPGSSGMYPIEMMPGFFQWLHPLLPFTYGINLLRETVGGMYSFNYLFNLCILGVFLIVALFIGLQLRPLLLNLNLLFDKQLATTGLMICESNDMPPPSKHLNKPAERMRHRPPPFCFFTQGDAMEQRNRGIDLLRMTAMWMVVILHILNKGGVLAAAAPLSAGQGTARLLETAAYCAVNCYGLISGYVGVQRRFRYSGALALWLRVAFYTLGITAVFACLMPGSVNGDRVLRAFFPVLFRQYWYVTAYFGMCLFIPFFNLLLNRLSKGQLRLLALSIVLVFSVLPTLRQKDVFLTDNGYSVLWLSCLYLLGGVLRLCGSQTSRRPASRGAIYAGCVLATWLVRLAGDRLWMARTGHLCDKVLLTAYTSPTVLLAAVALVLCFAELNIGPRFGRFIESVSPLAFSVYLIHAHPLIWEHWLAGRFAFLADKPPILLASGVLGGAFAIYAVCSLADVLRAGLFRLFRVKAFSRWAEEAVSARLRPWLDKE